MVVIVQQRNSSPNIFHLPNVKSKNASNKTANPEAAKFQLTLAKPEDTRAHSLSLSRSRKIDVTHTRISTCVHRDPEGWHGAPRNSICLATFFFHPLTDTLTLFLCTVHTYISSFISRTCAHTPLDPAHSHYFNNGIYTRPHSRIFVHEKICFLFRFFIQTDHPTCETRT